MEDEENKWKVVKISHQDHINEAELELKLEKGSQIHLTLLFTTTH